MKKKKTAYITAESLLSSRSVLDLIEGESSIKKEFSPLRRGAPIQNTPQRPSVGTHIIIRPRIIIIKRNV